MLFFCAAEFVVHKFVLHFLCYINLICVTSFCSVNWGFLLIQEELRQDFYICMKLRISRFQLNSFQLALLSSSRQRTRLTGNFYTYLPVSGTIFEARAFISVAPQGRNRHRNEDIAVVYHKSRCDRSRKTKDPTLKVHEPLSYSSLSIRGEWCRRLRRRRIGYKIARTYRNIYVLKDIYSSGSVNN